MNCLFRDDLALLVSMLVPILYCSGGDIVLTQIAIDIYPKTQL